MNHKEIHNRIQQLSSQGKTENNNEEFKKKVKSEKDGRHERTYTQDPRCPNRQPSTIYYQPSFSLDLTS